ncbi:hypothetical protein TYRP_002683 [Tyrophagus putrescentiae]|nr:hypothetical protein TYRP_002683 [Tyrophagus putrescentiae]
MQVSFPIVQISWIMGLFDIFSKKDGKAKGKLKHQQQKGVKTSSKKTSKKTSKKGAKKQQQHQQHQHHHQQQPPQESDQSEQQQQQRQQAQQSCQSPRSTASKASPSPCPSPAAPRTPPPPPPTSPANQSPAATASTTTAAAAAAAAGGGGARHGHHPSKSPARSVQSFDLERELATPHLEPSSPVSSVFQKTYDCVAFVLHCPAHGKVAVARSPTEAIWLPYVQKHPRSAWYESAREGAMQVLAEGSATRFEALRRRPPFEQLLLLEVARVQMPSTNRFVARYIFYVRLNAAAAAPAAAPTPLATTTTSPTNKKPATSNAGAAAFKCCTDTARLQWLAVDFVSQGLIRNCWGPELVELARQVMVVTAAAAAATAGTGEENQQQQQPPAAAPVFRQRLQEQSVEQLFEILPRLDGSSQTSANQQCSPDSHTESLKKIKTSKNDIERLFADYLDHCYPSFYMTYDSFRHYLARNGFETNQVRVKRFFRAFNRAANGYLSFNELLLGLICMERETPHVEFRIRFVFNYYDTRSRGVLGQEDFALMLADMNVDKHGRAVLNEAQLRAKAVEAMACFRTKTLETVEGIGSHAFRGTSNLCRSRCNVFVKINRRLAARAVKMNVANAKGRLASMVTRTGYQGRCQGCRAKRYRVAAHLTVLGADGYFEAGAVVPLAQSSSGGAVLKKTSLATFAADPRSNILDDALKLMALIRQYNESKPRTPPGAAGGGGGGGGPGRPLHGLMTGPEDRERLVRLLRALVAEIVPLLANEPRCKQVTSPAFIIGDIHGNLEDLMSMERTLWRRFPEVNGMHYLFLGDYVDRGRWSIECALYLFAMKVLRPANVTLLRGNHEVRDIQVKYTYYYECRSKYGDALGQEVWALTNRVFDHLPLCAVVDENLYCAHGGLPYSAQTLEEISVSIPVELATPEQECDVAWEIMWSDPMAPEMFREAGTATFLAANQLTHVIRAHEVPRFGFIFHFNFKCTTIFSCSHYCGNDNDCAVVFVDRASMRIIRIDTSANISATD